VSICCHYGFPEIGRGHRGKTATCVTNTPGTCQTWARLPEGAEVEVRLLSRAGPQEEGEENVPTLYERLTDIVGKAEGLPPDLAENHDYYLHGQAKR
jgi:hypothetical protein